MDPESAVDVQAAVPHVSIKAAAKTCQELFADALSLPTKHLLPVGSDLQDEYGRFNLWTTTMSVFAPDQTCLDFRLKDVPEASHLFIKQLGILGTRVEQLQEQLSPEHVPSGSSASLEPWHVEDILRSIHETIDWLHRLSNLVRKASVATQNERAAAFVLRDEVGSDITDSLRTFYKAIIRRESRNIDDALVDRLAQTMILRRKRILYRRSRQTRWIMQQVDDSRRALDILPTQTPHPSQDHAGSQDGEETASSNTNPPANEHREASSMLTVTVVDRETYLKQATPSRISRATSAPFQPSEKLLVPPRPRAAGQGKEFVCDYCCLILSSDQVSDHDKWAQHVKKDLDPYVCVFEDCPEPYQLYSSSEEWLAHMSSQHRTRWHCTARGHPPVSMETRQQFIGHMEEVHPRRFKKDQLGFIADSCARPLAPTIPNCPFCSESTENLDAHVGQHLHYFALLSMPWRDGPTKDAGAASTYGRDDSSSSERLERATLQDTFDDIPPTTVGPRLGHAPAERYTLVGDERLSPSDPPPLTAPAVFPVIERKFPEVDETLENLRAWKQTTLDKFNATRLGEIDEDNEDSMDEQGHGSVSADGTKSQRIERSVQEPATASLVSHIARTVLRRSPHQDPTRPIVLTSTGGDDFQQAHNALSYPVSVGHAKIGKAQVDCQLLFQKTVWGVLGELERPGAIIYMDLRIDAPPDTRLADCTILITLTDGFGIPATLEHRLVSNGLSSKFTDYYGPQSMIIDSSGTTVKLSSHITSSLGSIWYNTMRLELKFIYLDKSPMVSDNYPLAFAIEHNADEFYLITRIFGKPARPNLNLLRFRSSGNKNEEVITKFHFPNGYQKHQRLDNIAKDLSTAMERENPHLSRLDDPEWLPRLKSSQRTVPGGPGSKTRTVPRRPWNPEVRILEYGSGSASGPNPSTVPEE